ncbi:hypothetical protein PISL3812_05028 [Talaromyces islandicus]|uniref:Uncharacterized protein n=1 Tax=Talaromyces islandicus TaxID=28573 RepID=A0A0U1LXB1_TALIS|nr:hypothetical protein PISL3812_05028 [Talaromyces islandicus]
MTDNTGSSPPRRHWNGEIGARHEHQNVWMNGGVRSPAGPAPWAGWDADRKRRASEASAKSTGSTSSSSGKTNSPLFEKLHTQKRGSDASSAERRKSWAEMAPEKGFFERLWHGYTRGSK